jgi:acyl-CoA thioester hydrolase
VTNTVFRHAHRVTYSECTIGNHVYYGRYLDFLEEARGEFFRQLGQTLTQWQELDLILPVIEARIRYKASARYDDWVNIDVWVGQLEGVRVGFEYRLTNQDNVLLAEASTNHVCANLKEKPRRPPPEFVRVLSPYRRIADADSAPSP